MLRGYNEDCLKRKPLPRKFRGKNILQRNGFQLYEKETEEFLIPPILLMNCSAFSWLASAHATVEQ